tara:strand:- start:4091 stop:4423 length:333 start_codon:yes stop_codon:yes gene_type:complete
MPLERFIKVAIQLAKKSNMMHKHGAVLIYRNKIVGRGYNHYCKYRKNYDGRFKSIHAEVMAINNCPNQSIVSKCKLIVVRFVGGEMKLSLPCANCQKYLKKKKILTVYHS